LAVAIALLALFLFGALSLAARAPRNKPATPRPSLVGTHTMLWQGSWVGPAHFATDGYYADFHPDTGERLYHGTWTLSGNTLRVTSDRLTPEGVHTYFDWAVELTPGKLSGRHIPDGQRFELHAPRPNR
jgi:hypothetical protein